MTSRDRITTALPTLSMKGARIKMREMITKIRDIIKNSHSKNSDAYQVVVKTILILFLTMITTRGMKINIKINQYQE